MTNREALLAEAAELRWFHAIDLGQIQTPGRFLPDTPQNRTLFGIMDMLKHVDLTGLHCLDIGTMDGLIAFGMASLGAARVVATDIPKDGRPTFKLARALLDLDIEFVGDTTFANIIDKLGEHQFDVVVCSGVLYHMLNPFDAVLISRRLLKRNGLLLLQSIHHDDVKGATLDFNPVSGRLKQTGTFWVPSRAAVTGMLAVGGFEVLGVRTGTEHLFITALARNVRPEEVTDPRGLIRTLHQRGISYKEFQKDLPEPASTVDYRGPHGDAVIDDVNFQPDFPYHPTDALPVVGQPYQSPNITTVSQPVVPGVLGSIQRNASRVKAVFRRFPPRGWR